MLSKVYLEEITRSESLDIDNGTENAIHFTTSVQTPHGGFNQVVKF
jgi:hypothetical protein